VNRAVLILYFIDFLLIALLPRIFFKKGGKLNLKWWLTALPVIACLLTIFSCYLGWIAPVVVYAGGVERSLEILTVLIGTLSIGIIFLTLGTHKIPIALWHQENDAPQSIVTYGAYKYIRHPFYSSFLLAYLGVSLACPHPVTILCTIYSWIALNLTARREENRLSASAFGEEYKAYMKRTGRFFPKLVGQ
jgi:protein-S-isoprenylcysteine O-methyltransferase Ste14